MLSAYAFAGRIDNTGQLARATTLAVTLPQHELLDSRAAMRRHDDNVEVVAASTRRHPAEGLRIYDHWEKLLLDNEVDLVAITTPPNLHAAIAGAAMEAGKHVLIEKPVATAAF